MTSIKEYNLTTVTNKDSFEQTVEVKECHTVGRSLVAKKALNPGDVVLVETPLIQYDLKPACRSNKSPYFSKKLWASLISITQQHEDPSEQVAELPVQEEEEDDKDSYDSYQDSDEEEEEEEKGSIDSDFVPGVPAAILAYLDIHPPSKYNNVRRRRTYQSDDFDFFYYPTEASLTDHKTVQLIHTVSQQVVDTEPLYSHIDAKQLANFVLKIYSNAHTVALPRQRDTPTHTHKKYRRELYKHKFEENDTYWGQDAEEVSATPTIALLRWGSKFAHSCSPNMFLRFEPAKNAMVFTVVKPLAVGDILTFSYLPEDDLAVGGLICGTTVDRQAKLEKFKFFKCGCDRCSDYDWSRGVVCEECGEITYVRGDMWKCGHNAATYIGDREKNVTKMVMGFASRVYGTRPMTQAMMRMLEPYLNDLLSPQETDVIAVSQKHWNYAIINSLLASYHLTLFPQSFGKGLASQLGLTVKGLEEALVYMKFLKEVIYDKGNPMAAFFAGWRVLAIVIKVVMDATENKYHHVAYEPSDSSDTSDSDSDGSDRSDNEEDKEEEETVIKEEEPIVKEKEEGSTETELIPLQEDWIDAVTKISTISKELIPLITQVFKERHSPVVEDMLDQIRLFNARIEELL